ncbi:hypothetical protein GGI12_005355 [Dipsacomyces acuminosporus]|nr:hypothetical protein GGI12_005355 [Dipsacomyces acuminosporus]
MYDADFGDGIHQWASFIPGLKYTLAMIQPCPPGVDGINLYVDAPEAVMQSMLDNEFWMGILRFGYFAELAAYIAQLGHAKMLATTACLFITYRVIYALYLSPLRKVPGPFLARLAGTRALFYNVTGNQVHQALEDLETYGDIHVYKPNSVVVSNPADIRAVLGTHMFRKGDIYKAMDYENIETTTSARDPKFASMRRRQIGPYFTNSYLAKMEETILQHGILAIKKKWDSLLEASDNGQAEINYHQTFHYASFDTIGSLAFGRDFGALRNEDSTVAEWMNSTVIYLVLRSLFVPLKIYPFSLLLSPLQRLHEEYKAYSIECVSARRRLLEKLEKSGELDKKPADLLQGFIDTMDPESRIKMSPTEVHAETQVMMGAGSDTTSSTLTWTVHLLMLYPQCYKRAVDEIRSAFGRDHVITYNEAKAQLPYLEACINESLRVGPVIGGYLARLAPREGVTLGSGHFIPGGTEINVSIIGANYNRKHWKDPHCFDPARFLGDEEAKRNIFSFSYGVRVCPGRQLAWVELLTILANILKDYDLKVPSDYKLRGPHVLGKDGHPRLMESRFYATNAPANVERDCRLVVSKHY